MQKLIAGLILTMLVGCGAEDGASLEILEESIPSGACIATADPGVSRSQGFWDPRGSHDVPVGDYYAMPLVLRNNLRTAGADPATSFSADNRRVDANSLQLVGFDVCWVRADADGGPAAALGYGEWTDGVPDKLQCDNLPKAQRGWVPASTRIEPEGGTAGTFARVLGDAALQSLYGAAFAPREIPDFGRFDPLTGLASATGSAYASVPVSPALSPRDAAWGNYPHTQRATVLLQLRATARDQAGRSIQSNWFVHAVDLCVGCLADFCGPLTVGVTAAGDPCLEGSVVDYADACLPAQGYELVCADGYSTCGA